mmetsp:Transcript_44031/g.106171  ORF Transcript_44031/g.106171 Transcript_44031/m.106171 type:complete len:424 (-) Transcript_44031:451-1722(-)
MRCERCDRIFENMRLIRILQRKLPFDRRDYFSFRQKVFPLQMFPNDKEDPRGAFNIQHSTLRQLAPPDMPFNSEPPKVNVDSHSQDINEGLDSRDCTACIDEPLLTSRRQCPSWMAAALLIMVYAVSRTVGSESVLDLLFGSNQQDKPETNQTNEASILFLIYCGGPSGRADMEAIVQTWGRHLTHVLILSNTPDDLSPILTEGRNRNNTASWNIIESKMLNDGAKRSSKDSWKETVQKVNEELQRHPSIQWIVRSDSDTWWNVPLLEDRLRATILPPDEPLVMGQFFPLVNFKWVREVSAERSDVPDLTQSNGTDAYLSGGAGLILTRTSMQKLHACFPTVTLKSRAKEDIWFSPLAHACNVTLVHSQYMHQFPWDIQRLEEVPSTLSLHHVAGDGRKGYARPSHYENALKEYGYKQKNAQR